MNIINTINGTHSGNTLIGSAYKDIIYGLGGSDAITGGAGADIINSGTGKDTVSYVSSNAAVNINLSLTTTQSGGDAEGDVLSSIENIIGSIYDDTLTGNSGANILTGGSGMDILSGKAGADVFKYSAVTDSGKSAGMRDIIVDFDSLQADKIDLGSFSGSFVFIGTDAFTGTTLEANYAQVNGATIISVDIDGNGALDFQIEMTGLHTLTAADFLL